MGLYVFDGCSYTPQSKFAESTSWAIAIRRCHLNPARYLRPYGAAVASFLRRISSGARGFLRRHGKTTVVICPAMELPAEVRLDPDLRMESCSRWPELQSCSQSCMPQVQFSAEDLYDFAARYEGKQCASCGAALTRDDWYKSRLAVLGTNTGVPKIPEVVRPSSFSIPEKSDPICSACYGAKYPDCSFHSDRWATRAVSSATTDTRPDSVPAHSREETPPTSARAALR